MQVTVVRCSCRCGGNWAWMRKKPDTGAWEMVGCICHHNPLPKDEFIPPSKAFNDA